MINLCSFDIQKYKNENDTKNFLNIFRRNWFITFGNFYQKKRPNEWKFKKKGNKNKDVTVLKANIEENALKWMKQKEIGKQLAYT